MSATVCMATYNGEEFVEEQVRSILDQLATSDQLIVIDDCSQDATVEVVRAIGDARIELHINERNRGEVYSFSRALLLARNDVVFLADQDDVWLPGRVASMTEALNAAAASVVSSNFDWMDTNGTPIHVPYDGVSAARSTHHARNIFDIFVGRTNYYGCAMALRREFVPVVAPIPTFVESHDLWIAMAANVARSNVHLDDNTLRKRKHASNVTSTVSTRSLYRKLRSRVIFVASLVALLARAGRLSTPAVRG